jgi:hypothetical protein
MYKKITTLALACGLLLTSLGAQAQAFDKGKSIVSVGYGFPNLGASIFKSAYGTEVGYKVTGIGPMFLKYEYGVSEKIGLGIIAGYSGFTIKWQEEYSTYNSTTGTYSTGYYNWNLKYTSPSVGVRFNYHFATKDKLDPYFGVGAGWRGGSFSYSTDDPNGTGTVTKVKVLFPVYMPITVGMRYYFTDNIGAYIELGIDKGSVVQGGLALKF